MNRRAFLAALVGGAALDKEKLLWQPGKKLISIPKPRVYTVRDLIQAAYLKVPPRPTSEEIDAVFREFNATIDAWGRQPIVGRIPDPLPYWPERDYLLKAIDVISKAEFRRRYP